MAVARKHSKPAVSKEAKEAAKVAEQMYMSLLAKDAPKATPTGYIMGASMVFKMLIDQAEKQGGDRTKLKEQTLAYIQGI